METKMYCQTGKGAFIAVFEELNREEWYAMEAKLLPVEQPAEKPAGLYFRIPQSYSLTDKSCCIVSNGEFHYCVIRQVNLATLYGTPMPLINEETFIFENAVESLIYIEDDKTMAVSGIDIESITVFNDDFEVELSIKRPEK